MLRKFTKDVGRFKQGEEHDWPKATWTQLETTEGKSLNSFSEAVEYNPSHQNMLKRRIHTKQRLGSGGGIA